MRYTGKQCSRIISPTMAIYINSYNKQDHIETKLNTAYKQISDLKGLGDQCRPYVLPLLCHYLFPYCNSTAPVPSPRQLCIDECEMLQMEVCAKEYKMVLLSSPSGTDTSLQPVLLPNCSALPPRGSAGWKGCIRFKVKSPVIKKPKQKGMNTSKLQLSDNVQLICRTSWWKIIAWKLVVVSVYSEGTAHSNRTSKQLL